ncbi:hypothetical protein HOE04_03685 [archaeon]|jgi:hypothetical protein|nr:hypothetical protein [archaeon]
MKKRIAWSYGIIATMFLYILYYFRNSDHFAGAIAFVLTVSFFHLADRIFKIQFKKHHYAILLFMATFGVLLSQLYLLVPYYDKILHYSFPFIGCFLVFYIVNKLKIDFKTKVFFTFTIMITLIAIEEIVEFSLDWLFNLKLQGRYEGEMQGLLKIADKEQLRIVQSRITDTMTDLMLGFLGSLTFVTLKFLRNKEKDK